MDTAGGTNNNISKQKRTIDRTLGKAQNGNNSESNILKTFHNFDDWTKNNLSNYKLARTHS